MTSAKTEKRTEIRYRKHKDKILIELRLNQARQLFDNRDPSPFIFRDLDPDAVDYLVQAVREIRGGHSFEVVIHLLDLKGSTITEGEIREAIHSYFKFEGQFVNSNLRASFRRAYISLFIGLIVLGTAIILSHLAKTHVQGDLLNRVLSEGFIILGWVAMWKPLELLLYEWWPILQKRKLFDRLAVCEVSVHGPSLKETERHESRR